MNETQEDLEHLQALLNRSIEQVRDITIQPITPGDREWVQRFMSEHWDGEMIVSREKTHNVSALEGFIALFQGEKAGLITYDIEGNNCEIITLDSIKPDVGIGTALVEAVKVVARQQGCKRLWLITTNDNLHALGFYQKRGFELVAVHRNAVEAARRLKPQIPLTGYEGIPLRDEIELEERIIYAFPGSTIQNI